MRVLFFIGKGGVGKSTSAALKALQLSAAGHKTLLISMDPAHNQGDIFNKTLGEQSKKVLPSLWLRELDIQLWTRRYLESVRDRVKESYRYLTAFNLEHYFDILEQAPGTEEFAMFQAYKQAIAGKGNFDFILFDMPPTAVSLKFFGLPHLSLIWLEKLQGLRQTILDKRSIISQIRFGKKLVQTDVVSTRIQKELKRHKLAADCLADHNQSAIQLVVTPDSLALQEAQRICHELEKYAIRPARLILNKYVSERGIQLPGELRDLPLHTQPLSPQPLLGMQALTGYRHLL